MLQSPGGHFCDVEILRLLFSARIALFNNRCLAPGKTKTITEAREA